MDWPIVPWSLREILLYIQDCGRTEVFRKKKLAAGLGMWMDRSWGVVLFDVFFK